MNLAATSLTSADGPRPVADGLRDLAMDASATVTMAPVSGVRRSDRAPALPSPVDADAADAAMDRYACGDDDAFEAVYDALAPRLLRFLGRQLRDQARAEDLLQQTLLQIVAGRASFMRGGRVVPWAFAIARRLLIDASRKGRRQVRIAEGEDLDASPPPSHDPSADRVVHARQLAARVQVELAAMPESQRVAFELTRLDGLSLAEAADVLATTPNAVKVRVYRATEALRAIFGDQLPEESR